MSTRDYIPRGVLHSMSPNNNLPMSGSDGSPNMQRLRNLYQAQKPDIRIKLNDERDVYTTLDQINGVVSITAPRDTSFDDIEVAFLGTSKTYVERLTTAAAISGRSEAFHQFLKMEDKSVQDRYPEGNMLKAGVTYEFPFYFVVPQQLLPRICTHKVVSPALRDAHTQLPPTFGDRENESPAETKAIDDMVPEMASIRYGVHARVSKNRFQDDDVVRTTIVNKAKKLRVIPASAEQPPLDTSADSEYVTRKERLLRKGVLKGKLGTLVVEAMEPPTMHMQARARPNEPTTSMATITLRFDPAEEGVQPPRLGSLASKLKVCTFYASTARQVHPTKTMSLQDLAQGLHSEQLNLSTRCMAGVKWATHQPHKPASRRDSACSTASMDSPKVPMASEAYKGKSFFTAELKVPVTLPANKIFVPTFHSCLISRIYQLKLELSVGLAGTVDLRLPLQITCEGSRGDLSPRRTSVSSGLEISDDDDVADFFEPRQINVPHAAYSGHSNLHGLHADDAPPDYSLFAPPMSVPVY